MVTSEVISEIAGQLQKSPSRSIRYLQEHGYIVRVLRGVFYVKSATERETGVLDRSVFEIVAESLNLKGVRNWYIALETALRVNELTHEYFAVNFVMTDGYRTTKAIRILDTKFWFLRRSKEQFSFGVERRFDLKFSDKEKTVLDLVHKRYIDTKDERLAVAPYLEHRDGLDNQKILRYVKNYPRRIQIIVGGVV